MAGLLQAAKGTALAVERFGILSQQGQMGAIFTDRELARTGPVRVIQEAKLAYINKRI